MTEDEMHELVDTIAEMFEGMNRGDVLSVLGTLVSFGIAHSPDPTDVLDQFIDYLKQDQEAHPKAMEPSCLN
jgi:hypothetical protein